MTESELVEHARAGNGQAIQALYRRHAARVLSVVRRLAGDDAMAEDLAQDAWVEAIRALPRFRADSRFSTWLHRIAVNRALQGIRRRERERRRDELAAPEAAGSAGPGQDRARPGATPEDRTLIRIRLERALDRLPPRMRAVIVLHDVEGYTHMEIAERLGVSEGTSKSQLFKARARMRALLSARPSDSLEDSYVATP